MRTIPRDAAPAQDPTSLVQARLDSDPAPAFPTIDRCKDAALALYDPAFTADPTPGRRNDVLQSAAASIGVTPGGITLYKRIRPLGRELADPADPLGQQQFPHVDDAVARFDEDVDPFAAVGPPLSPLSEVGPERVTRWWSARSRSRMIRALASVDWRPVFLTPGTRPAMVTLTYPGDWITAAPTSAAAKKHLVMIHKRIVRVFEANDLHDLAAVWKLEFQRRGAPHFHLYMPVPVAKVRTKKCACAIVDPDDCYCPKVRFRDWLSQAWADVVDHPDDEEKRRHVLAGTGVDFGEGARCSDPKRLAVYFTRHNAKGSRSKEYQHRIPDQWADAGRWWGTWGVERINEEAPVTETELVEVKRLLRRWIRSQGRVTPRRVRRGVSTSGVVQHRWVTRRYEVKSLRQSLGGFVIANDGPALAAMVARYLDALRLEPEPS